MKNRSNCEPVILTDQQSASTRSGNRSEIISQSLHSRYREQTLRQNVFMAGERSGSRLTTSGSSVVSFVLVNPITSTRIASLIRWEMMVTNTPTTPVVGMYGLFVLTNLKVPPTAVSANSIPVSCGFVQAYEQKLGAGVFGSSVVQPHVFFSGGGLGTLPSAPTLYRVLENKLTGAETTITALLPFSLDFDGTCLLSPGTCIAVQQIGADTTNAVAMNCVVWEEIPL